MASKEKLNDNKEILLQKFANINKELRKQENLVSLAKNKVDLELSIKNLKKTTNEYLRIVYNIRLINIEEEE